MPAIYLPKRDRGRSPRTVVRTRGLLRIDGVYRKYEDFYATRIDQSTGQVVNELGDEFDVVITENTNDVERKYAGLNLSGSWRPGSRVTLGVGYTLSRTWATSTARRRTPGPCRRRFSNIPSIAIRAGASRPGDLTTDQRHKLRIVGTYTAPLERASAASPSAGFSRSKPAIRTAQSRTSRSSHSAAGAPLRERTGGGAVLLHRAGCLPHRAGVQHRRVGTLPVSAAARRDLELFVKADVLNVFNNHAVINSQYLNLAVPTNVSAPGQYAAFNPFTETPVRGVNWDLGPTFGEPSSRFAYQTPRTFRMSFGVRF